MRPLSVCLINPRFEPSYWGYDHVLPFMAGDKRCWTVTGALPALAALAPPHCTIELIDENVEPIDFDRLDRFDVVGVTGMVVQAQRMKAILERLRGARATIVVGGPYVSVAESQLASLCDTRFIGEAEETWPAFLEALGRGEAVAERYEQAERTDMATVPVPRYDLVKSGRYVMASLQFSRGCPFRCEFCDIITIFGRRPRLKTPEQMLAEFDAIREAGFRTCFLVDDNFIGNKAKAKELLRALIGWQKRHGYPLDITTEASINLADDAEMIALMREANMLSVFVGIESPRAASLSEVQKIQNVRGDSMIDKLGRIRGGGIQIAAGFIVGFDNDDEAIFEEQFAFIEEAAVAFALVAVLTPIPTTPLYDRLVAEGRLDFADHEVIYRPKGMSREALKRGYAALMRRLYEPEAFLGRAFAGYVGSAAYRTARRRLALDTGRRPGPVARLRATVGGVRLMLRLARAARAAGLGRLASAYARAWWRLNRPLGRERMPVQDFVGLCLYHWHFHRIANGPRRGAFGAVLPADLPLFEEDLRAA
jgi:radical SAM superfamily enzyme YgiQ (UPF0313 family)